MAEYVNLTDQVVNPGESVVFTTTTVPCTSGLVRHRDGSGNFLLAGRVANSGCSRCGTNRNKNAEYLINFKANIAVPADQTAGEISLALSVDGATEQSSSMIVTPADTETFFNVGVTKNIEIWNGCCESFSVRNTSTIPVTVRTPVVNFSRPDLNVTK